MVETLSDADIFCFPSYREGFPKVFLEASSMEILLLLLMFLVQEMLLLTKKLVF